MAAIALPSFTTLHIDTFKNKLDLLLKTHLQQIEALVANASEPTWDSLMKPLEDMDDELERYWSPFSHLHAVVNSPTLRDCYQACLPLLSAYEASIGHNRALYSAIMAINRQTLNETQCKILDDALRDFKLSGVALNANDKSRFEAIQARLSELSNQFENHVLDATQAYEWHTAERTHLGGLPEHAIETARQLAEEKGVPGWVLNLEFPSYLAVITYADDRSLRELFYEAYVTRASDQGPHAGQFDNTTIMDEMLALRHEKAIMLGFANYAELSLATKMADSTDNVIHFLSDLSQRAYPQAEKEYQTLQRFAVEKYGINQLAPWDIAYLSEKKRQAEYALSQEELRPYFPLPKVMTGLFSIVNKLYGMTMEEVHHVDTWHADVACYRVLDENQQARGYVYTDLFSRQNKRGGAWMDSLQSRRRLNHDEIQLPIATLTCNFAKPAAHKTPLLSHDEVLTLFHEFGHCLHHVLTKVDYLSAAGINGVEWDAVELPSQFFENWCWEKEALAQLTAHIETGAPLPSSLFEKLINAKNFQSAMAMMRQLEFSLFDFRIHQAYQPKTPPFIATILGQVRKQTAVVPIAPYNRFQHSFSHIFGGGYAAGYYSYKWAEVLSSDAFARFEEEGVFNENTGRDFLHQILEVGGSRKAADAFVRFRGREATIDALLRHSGINQ